MLGLATSSFRWFVLLCLFNAIAVTEAQCQDIHGLYHSRWTVRDGVPRYIRSIASDADGLLWLGSDDGLYRFDGVAFETYRLPSAPAEYPFHDIGVLKATPEGLWIGYVTGGVSLLSGGQLTTYGQKDGLAPGEIHSITRAPGGSVWVATEYGLSRFDGRRWHDAGFKTSYPHSHPNAIFFDSRGTLWASTATGLFFLLKNDAGFVLADSHVTQNANFSEGSDGKVWFASRPFGVRIITNEQGVYTPHGASVAYASSGVLLDRTGALWVTTIGQGLVRTEASSLVGPSRRTLPPENIFTERDGLTGNFTHHVLEDREGSVWVISDKGLDQFHRSRFNPVPLPPESEFVGVAIDRSGQLIIGSKQVSRVAGRKLTVLVNGPENVGCIYADMDGTVWLNSRDGLWSLSGRGLRQHALPLSLHGDSRSIQTMTMDKARGLWVSFVGVGLYELSHGNWSQPDLVAGLPVGPPLISFTAGSGTLWFGYPNNKVATVDEGRTRIYGPAEGVNVGTILAIQEIDGRLWIGGTKGLDYLKDGRFEHVTLSGPPLSGVSGIAQSPDHSIWLNTTEGIFRLEGAKIDRILRDPDQRIVADQFTYLDGITGEPEQVRPLPTVIRRADGRLFFTTRANVIWIDPAHIDKNSLAPAVAVRSLISGSKTFLDPGDITLPVRSQDVVINYSASSLLIPERVRFRYWLDGADKTWQDVGTQRQVSFAKLPPGTYIFHVKASNDDGIWNESGAQVRFSIAPTITQRTSFRFFCMCVLVAILWLAYWLRIQTVERNVRKRLIERIREREDIARDLHDTFLQSVQGLVLSFHTGTSMISTEHPSRKILDGALQSSDRVLHEGRHIVTQLRSRVSEHNELSNDLTSAEAELRHGSSIQFRLKVIGAPRELPSVIRDDLCQIGREAMCNAFRHSNGKLLQIILSYGVREFILEIKDDGIGIDQAILAAGGRPNHWGLVGMQERAKRIGATLDIKSGPSIGTRIGVCLPGRLAYGNTSRNRSLLERLAASLRVNDHG
jgi:ligand-binding sensor domain-containing protein